MGANLVVAILILCVTSHAQNNEYIDRNTIVLALVLAAQTHLALAMERRRRDPFVILLVFTMIFYFSLRIVTLALYPFSSVFLRYSYGPANSNFALTFIIAANVFLYAGLWCVRSRQNIFIRSEAWIPTSPTRIVVLMLVSIIYSYLSGVYWTPDDMPRIVGFVGIFVSPVIILQMALSYFILFRRSMNRMAALLIATLIVLEVAAHTLAGSRSGITTLLQNTMVAMLAIWSCIQVKRKVFIVSCALAPVVLVLLIGAFTLSTYNRSHKDAVGSVDLVRAVELAGEATTEIGADTELDILLPPIFDRAGFFDYSAEIIANRDQYGEVFKLSSYAKSIVDNLLTPGFDVYDQPKASNALQFIYEDLGTPSKEMVSESYQSDQFGIYGEFYGLFGYGSLPLFFLAAFLLKRGYVRLTNNSPFVFAMKRIVVLSVFIKIIDSYGMDWTIIETVPLVASVFLYTFFFRSRRIAPRIAHGPAVLQA